MPSVVWESSTQEHSCPAGRKVEGAASYPGENPGTINKSANVNPISKAYHSQYMPKGILTEVQRAHYKGDVL